MYPRRPQWSWSIIHCPRNTICAIRRDRKILKKKKKFSIRVKRIARTTFSFSSILLRSSILKKFICIEFPGQIELNMLTTKLLYSYFSLNFIYNHWYLLIPIRMYILLWIFLRDCLHVLYYLFVICIVLSYWISFSAYMFVLWYCLFTVILLYRYFT